MVSQVSRFDGDPDMTFEKNFIRPLPEGQDAAVDESLLWLQLRTRKRSEWGRLLKEFIDQHSTDTPTEEK